MDLKFPECKVLLKKLTQDEVYQFSGTWNSVAINYNRFIQEHQDTKPRRVLENTRIKDKNDNSTLSCKKQKCGVSPHLYERYKAQRQKFLARRTVVSNSNCNQADLETSTSDTTVQNSKMSLEEPEVLVQNSKSIKSDVKRLKPSNSPSSKHVSTNSEKPSMDFKKADKSSKKTVPDSKSVPFSEKNYSTCRELKHSRKTITSRKKETPNSLLRTETGEHSPKSMMAAFNRRLNAKITKTSSSKSVTSNSKAGSSVKILEQSSKTSASNIGTVLLRSKVAKSLTETTSLRSKELAADQQTPIISKDTPTLNNGNNGQSIDEQIVSKSKAPSDKNKASLTAIRAEGEKNIQSSTSISSKDKNKTSNLTAMNFEHRNETSSLTAIKSKDQNKTSILAAVKSTYRNKASSLNTVKSKDQIKTSSLKAMKSKEEKKGNTTVMKSKEGHKTSSSKAMKSTWEHKTSSSKAVKSKDENKISSLKAVKDVSRKSNTTAVKSKVENRTSNATVVKSKEENKTSSSIATKSKNETKTLKFLTKKSKKENEAPSSMTMGSKHKSTDFADSNAKNCTSNTENEIEAAASRALSALCMLKVPCSIARSLASCTSTSKSQAHINNFKAVQNSSKTSVSDSELQDSENHLANAVSGRFTSSPQSIISSSTNRDESDDSQAPVNSEVEIKMKIKRLNSSERDCKCSSSWEVSTIHSKKCKCDELNDFKSTHLSDDDSLPQKKPIKRTLSKGFEEAANKNTEVDKSNKIITATPPLKTICIELSSDSSSSNDNVTESESLVNSYSLDNLEKGVKSLIRVKKHTRNERSEKEKFSPLKYKHHVRKKSNNQERFTVKLSDSCDPTNSSKSANSESSANSHSSDNCTKTENSLKRVKKHTEKESSGRKKSSLLKDRHHIGEGRENPKAPTVALNDCEILSSRKSTKSESSTISYSSDGCTKTENSPKRVKKSTENEHNVKKMSSLLKDRHHVGENPKAPTIALSDCEILSSRKSTKSKSSTISYSSDGCTKTENSPKRVKKSTDNEHNVKKISSLLKDRHHVGEGRENPKASTDCEILSSRKFTKSESSTISYSSDGCTKTENSPKRVKKSTDNELSEKKISSLSKDRHHVREGSKNPQSPTLNLSNNCDGDNFSSTNSMKSNLNVKISSPKNSAMPENSLNKAKKQQRGNKRKSSPSKDPHVHDESEIPELLSKDLSDSCDSKSSKTLKTSPPVKRKSRELNLESTTQKKFKQSSVSDASKKKSTEKKREMVAKRSSPRKASRPNVKRKFLHVNENLQDETYDKNPDILCPLPEKPSTHIKNSPSNIEHVGSGSKSRNETFYQFSDVDAARSPFDPDEPNRTVRESINLTAVSSLESVSNKVSNNTSAKHLNQASPEVTSKTCASTSHNSSDILSGIMKDMDHLPNYKAKLISKVAPCSCCPQTKVLPVSPQMQYDNEAAWKKGQHADINHLEHDVVHCTSTQVSSWQKICKSCNLKFVSKLKNQLMCTKCLNRLKTNNSNSFHYLKKNHSSAKYRSAFGKSTSGNLIQERCHNSKNSNASQDRKHSGSLKYGTGLSTVPSQLELTEAQSLEKTSKKNGSDSLKASSSSCTVQIQPKLTKAQLLKKTLVKKGDKKDGGEYGETEMEGMPRLSLEKSGVVSNEEDDLYPSMPIITAVESLPANQNEVSPYETESSKSNILSSELNINIQDGVLKQNWITPSLSSSVFVGPPVLDIAVFASSSTPVLSKPILQISDPRLTDSKILSPSITKDTYGQIFYQRTSPKSSSRFPDPVITSVVSLSTDEFATNKDITEEVKSPIHLSKNFINSKDSDTKIIGLSSIDSGNKQFSTSMISTNENRNCSTSDCHDDKSVSTFEDENNNVEIGPGRDNLHLGEISDETAISYTGKNRFSCDAERTLNKTTNCVQALSSDMNENQDITSAQKSHDSPTNYRNKKLEEVSECSSDSNSLKLLIDIDNSEVGEISNESTVPRTSENCISYNKKITASDSTDSIPVLSIDGNRRSFCFPTNSSEKEGCYATFHPSTTSKPLEDSDNLKEFFEHASGNENVDDQQLLETADKISGLHSGVNCCSPDAKATSSEVSHIYVHKDSSNKTEKSVETLPLEKNSVGNAILDIAKTCSSYDDKETPYEVVTNTSENIGSNQSADVNMDLETSQLNKISEEKSISHINENCNSCEIEKNSEGKITDILVKRENMEMETAVNISPLEKNSVAKFPSLQNSISYTIGEYFSFKIPEFADEKVKDLSQSKENVEGKMDDGTPLLSDICDKATVSHTMENLISCSVEGDSDEILRDVSGSEKMVEGILDEVQLGDACDKTILSPAGDNCSYDAAQISCNTSDEILKDVSGSEKMVEGILDEVQLGDACDKTILSPAGDNCSYDAAQISCNTSEAISDRKESIEGKTDEETFPLNEVCDKSLIISHSVENCNSYDAENISNEAPKVKFEIKERTEKDVEICHAISESSNISDEIIILGEVMDNTLYARQTSNCNINVNSKSKENTEVEMDLETSHLNEISDKRTATCISEVNISSISEQSLNKELQVKHYPKNNTSTVFENYDMDFDSDVNKEHVQKETKLSVFVHPNESQLIVKESSSISGELATNSELDSDISTSDCLKSIKEGTVIGSDQNSDEIPNLLINSSSEDITECNISEFNESEIFTGSLFRCTKNVTNQNKIKRISSFSESNVATDINQNEEKPYDLYCSEHVNSNADGTFETNRQELLDLLTELRVGMVSNDEDQPQNVSASSFIDYMTIMAQIDLMPVDLNGIVSMASKIMGPKHISIQHLKSIFYLSKSISFDKISNIAVEETQKSIAALEEKIERNRQVNQSLLESLDSNNFRIVETDSKSCPEVSESFFNNHQNSANLDLNEENKNTTMCNSQENQPNEIPSALNSVHIPQFDSATNCVAAAESHTEAINENTPAIYSTSSFPPPENLRLPVESWTNDETQPFSVSAKNTVDKSIENVMLTSENNIAFSSSSNVYNSNNVEAGGGTFIETPASIFSTNDSIGNSFTKESINQISSTNKSTPPSVNHYYNTPSNELRRHLTAENTPRSMPQHDPLKDLYSYSNAGNYPVNYSNILPASTFTKTPGNNVNLGLPNQGLVGKRTSPQSANPQAMGQNHISYNTLHYMPSANHHQHIQAKEQTNRVPVSHYMTPTTQHLQPNDAINHVPVSHYPQYFTTERSATVNPITQSSSTAVASSNRDYIGYAPNRTQHSGLPPFQNQHEAETYHLNTTSPPVSRSALVHNLNMSVHPRIDFNRIHFHQPSAAYSQFPVNTALPQQNPNSSLEPTRTVEGSQRPAGAVDSMRHQLLQRRGYYNPPLPYLRRMPNRMAPNRYCLPGSVQAPNVTSMQSPFSTRRLQSEQMPQVPRNPLQHDASSGTQNQFYTHCMENYQQCRPTPQ